MKNFHGIISKVFTFKETFFKRASTKKYTYGIFSAKSSQQFVSF